MSKYNEERKAFGLELKALVEKHNMRMVGIYSKNDKTNEDSHSLIVWNAGIMEEAQCIITIARKNKTALLMALMALDGKDPNEGREQKLFVDETDAA
ncbi:MAG: hypothetical protein KGL39_11805 [Patescibacteria group bacterium]|nr:hypothetical protein [Patescibacteria group bacterium]